MATANEGQHYLKRREIVARELQDIFRASQLVVNSAGAYRHESLDQWGWASLAERLIDKIDRGKLG